MLHGRQMLVSCDSVLVQCIPGLYALPLIAIGADAKRIGSQI